MLITQYCQFLSLLLKKINLSAKDFAHKKKVNQGKVFSLLFILLIDFK